MKKIVLTYVLRNLNLRNRFKLFYKNNKYLARLLYNLFINIDKMMSNILSNLRI
jgi:hypothetical protein